MDANGKMVDLIIEDEYIIDFDTNIRTLTGVIAVWADNGLIDTIKKIPGIADVFEYNCRYEVNLDPRYDRKIVKQSIEAEIKLR